MGEHGQLDSNDVTTCIRKQRSVPPEKIPRRVTPQDVENMRLRYQQEKQSKEWYMAQFEKAQLDGVPLEFKRDLRNSQHDLRKYKRALKKSKSALKKSKSTND